MSARLKLTLAFAGTLLLITLAFVLSMGASRLEEGRRSAAQIATTTADMALSVVRQERNVISGTPASAIVYNEKGKPIVASQVVERLREIRHQYVVVFKDSTAVYPDSTWKDSLSADWAILVRTMRRIPTDHPVILQLSGGEIALSARDVNDTMAVVTRVATGVPVNPSGWADDLLISLIIAAVTAVGLATWAVWSLSGAVFDRVDRIRNEVAAIADGRSLHRRLSADGTGVELSRLIDTLNEMIARLETSFMALRRFTADASHELKTPLAVLRADVERAMHEKTTKTERMVALEEALHETTRMSDLVESLLTLARADEGRFVLDRQPVDLGALTQEVYETALILGEGAGVTVNLPFTTDVTVQGDRARLRQLFLNLVSNAIKYTPSGGRVDIGLGRHPTTVTFAVRDTGIGIAAVDLPHVFERFWRADRVRTRTAERGGVGLGLAISQWIAQAHHGTLTVSSRLGRGSLFTVTLPLDEPIPAAPGNTGTSEA